ncbi:MAG: DNA repair protein RecN, partial [Candidatus Wenzhouxiangella sp. M2_3B_020]
MLRSLAIRHFTIIDALELEFAPGFGVITGETGAGKSILVDALAQLLGDRADSGLVAEGADHADLTACFELPDDHEARDWLLEQAMDDDALLLRRRIPADGASRAWINGHPATIGQLREIGAMLVEIHGQHEHQRLMEPARQRAWLDRNVDPQLRERVAESARLHADSRRALDRLNAEFGTSEDNELLRFQLDELDRLDLQDGEFEQLDAEQRRLASVDELQRGYSEASTALDSDDYNALSLSQQAIRSLEATADREPALAEVLGMLETARVNLEEAAVAVHRLNGALENDPERLSRVEERLARTVSLARKHQVEPAELPRFHARLRRKAEGLEQFEHDRAEAERRLEEARMRWRDEAHALHEARREAAGSVADAVHDALSRLGMDEARLEFRIESDPEAPVSPAGFDRVEILFSANPGRSPQPLKKVASGGELSRFSLAMIIASSEESAGIVRIFDEIDAGVGGETAHAVGAFLRRVGQDGQA